MFLNGPLIVSMNSSSPKNKNCDQSWIPGNGINFTLMSNNQTIVFQFFPLVRMNENRNSWTGFHGIEKESICQVLEVPASLMKGQKVGKK